VAGLPTVAVDPATLATLALLLATAGFAVARGAATTIEATRARRRAFQGMQSAYRG
jgi:hypothetical protein